ncbi:MULTISPECIES: hypothetical protein [unclassified Mesobacillus]|uniref:YqgU-like beta propeller domain-containing protein n=1 Tax=unclassified Mesobacillus TaxID=2675270 RepID=UPI00203B2E6F|nr:MULTISPECIES: hypothetical protein [unclassified Mesobacillus]MCM3122397.1 hypothetical protein [Mesobacillus sp. MER 33]MCM3232361.1 hypothetical protein [Mesobacillus sp. MER 48]
MKENTYKTPYVRWIVLIIATSAYILSGCSQQLDVSLHKDASHSLDRIKETPGISFLGSEVIPIKLGVQEEFSKASGWLSNTEILYISNKNESSSILYSYSLITGQSTMLYKSGQPIITAEISPKKDKVMIHSSASEEGVLTVIDLSGKELYSGKIESYELSFEWNPFNDDLLIVSAFTEEWDFNTYLLNLKENSLKELQLPEPFVRWISEDMLIYQQWDENEISLKAPLKSFSISGNHSKTLFEDVYQFDSLGKYLLTIEVAEGENPGLGLYTFTREGIHSAGSLTAPLLTSFSGWVVPFYDLMDDGKAFMYLRAKEQGEADLYEGGFDLMKYQFGEDKEEMVFSELANEPLSCSPSGEMCLYGFQLERVMNIDTKEIIELVQ